MATPLQEGLEATVAPSVESLLTALAAYRAAGGEGLIFVNDDGLQLLDKFERRALLQPAPAYVLVLHMHWFAIELRATRKTSSRCPSVLYVSQITSAPTDLSMGSSVVLRLLSTCHIDATTW